MMADGDILDLQDFTWSRTEIIINFHGFPQGMASVTALDASVTVAGQVNTATAPPIPAVVFLKTV